MEDLRPSLLVDCYSYLYCVFQMQQSLNPPRLKHPQENRLHPSELPAPAHRFCVRVLLSASAQLRSVMDGQTAQMRLTRVTVFYPCCPLPKRRDPSVTGAQSFVTTAESVFCFATSVMDKETVWMDQMSSDVQKLANQVVEATSLDGGPQSLGVNCLMCPSQVSFSAPMERCASLDLRCVTGGLTVGIGPTKRTADGLARAVSFTVLTGAAAFRKGLCATERGTAWMARMSSAAVGTLTVALLNRHFSLPALKVFSSSSSSCCYDGVDV